MITVDNIEGGDKLDSYFQDIVKKLGAPCSLRVGFLEGATYPDGTPVALIAAIQEYGAPKAKIPPRPYFRTMIKDKSPGWGAIAANLLKLTEYNVPKTMALMGEGISGQLRDSIIELVAPPLSAVTLMLRKMRADNPNLVVTGKTVGEAARKVAAGETPDGVNPKPLVDTGHLLNSISYQVKT